MSRSRAMVCVVEASTVWTSPSAARAIDAAATADLPDLEQWASGLDVDARLDLHGRVDTQVRRGEPVAVLAERGEWLEVVAPWQPSPKDGRGYPGWVRRAHFADTEHAGIDPGAHAAGPSAGDASPVTPGAVLDVARRLVGVRYIWGGLGRWGIDCSGLVHLAFRDAGMVVPRDAQAQHTVSSPITDGEEQPGDLYFFARPDGFVYHVGFATGDGLMLHAPEGTGVVEEAPISPERRERLIGARAVFPR